MERRMKRMALSLAILMILCMLVTAVHALGEARVEFREERSENRYFINPDGGKYYHARWEYPTINKKY